MRSISFESHTADLRMLLHADTLAELFRAALEGMAEIMAPERSQESPGEAQKVLLSLEATDTTVLLIDFLSEALTLCHRRRVLFNEMHGIHISDRMIEAEVTGRDVERFAQDIKAVTYHQAEVHRDDSGRWTTRIVFDI